MKTVIVGGVAGGLSAAPRLRRLDGSREIVVFERGRYVSFANCGLPYYVGGVINSRDSLLLQTPESLASRFVLDLRVEHEVASIDSARKVVHVTDLRTGTTVASASEGFVLLNDGSRVRAHLVIEATGVRPEVIVARSAGLSIGPTGGIAVDRQQRRGDPAIFAVDDGVEKIDAVDASPTPVTMAGLANRHGRAAADAIAGHPESAWPALGTSIVGVFTLTVEMVGWSEKRLIAAGRSHRAIHTHPASHAT
jgi:NADPH-dependent 2,4-dienoyl-CoA reductase/sulfur reductase-like enzyme